MEHVDMSESFIVALDGRPRGVVGWMIPILRNVESDLCFIQGDTPEQGFGPELLEALAVEGRVTLLETAVPYDGPPAGGKYAFFFDSKSADVCEYAVRALVEQDAFRNPCKVRMLEEDNALLDFFIVSETKLRAVLAGMTTGLVRATQDALVRCYSEHRQFRLPSDHGAIRYSKLLMRVAHDSQQARKAVTYRGLTVLLGPNPEQFGRWLRVATKPWGFQSSIAFWEDKIESALLAVQLLARRSGMPGLGRAEANEFFAPLFAQGKLNLVVREAPAEAFPGIFQCAADDRESVVSTDLPLLGLSDLHVRPAVVDYWLERPSISNEGLRDSPALYERIEPCQ
jgi:hypothetical protein